MYDAIEEEEKNSKRKKSSSSSSRKNIPEIETESEEEVIEEEEEKPESCSSSETFDEDTITESFPVFQAEFRPYLQNCWDTISPPFPESDLKAAWYAAIFNVPKRKRGTLYIGKVTKRFLSEENGSVDCLELDCLKPASGPSSTILEEPPEHFGKDIGMFKAYDIIAGPLKIVLWKERNGNIMDTQICFVTSRPWRRKIVNHYLNDNTAALRNRCPAGAVKFVENTS